MMSQNKINHYTNQGAMRYEDMNVGTHGDTGIPEHLI